MNIVAEWLPQANYLGAFLVGLLGGVHCFGMCGGIVTALTFNTAENTVDTSTVSAKLTNLLAMGLLARHLHKWTRIKWVQQLAGAIVAGLGLWMLLGV